MKRATLLTMLVLAVPACGDDAATGPGGPGDNDDVASVTVTGSGTLTALGASLELSAQAFDEDGQALTGVTFAWTSSDGAVATVEDGTVVAVGNGSAAISAQANGISGAAAVTVAQEVAAVAFATAPGNASVHDTLPLTVEMRDANGHRAANFDNTVTLAIGTNPLGTGALTGTTSLQADTGVATFRVALDTPGAGYTLVATATGVMAETAPFNVLRPAVYVGAFGGSSAYMVALTADSTLDTIPVGSQPSGMAITPDGLYALASNRGSGTVFVIETAGNTVVDSIQVGSLNQLLTLSPDGSLAYVVNSSGGTISVIETAGFTVVATIPVGSNPIDVAFSPDGTRAWVATSGWSKVIATATHTVVDSLNTTGGTRIGVAVSGDGQSVYIGAGNRVLVFAAATAALVDSVTGLASPQLMTTSLDGGSIFVANTGSATVSRISTATNTVTATIAVGSAPVGIATGPDGLIYVAGGSILSIINPANNLVIDTVTIPNVNLADLAVMPHPVP